MREPLMKEMPVRERVETVMELLREKMEREGHSHYLRMVMRHLGKVVEYLDQDRSAAQRWLNLAIVETNPDGWGAPEESDGEGEGLL